MNSSITIMSLVAVAITGLAFIHETRLRRAAHGIACRLILALRRHSKARDSNSDRQ